MAIWRIAMMRRQEITAIFLVVFLSAALVLILLNRDYFLENSNVVELLARSPDKGNWSPQTIYVEKNKRIILRIKNVDVNTHGFYLPEFDITIKGIKASEVEEVFLFPKKEGEYPFYCCVWCGDYHMQMRGKLVVR